MSLTAESKVIILLIAGIIKKRVLPNFFTFFIKYILYHRKQKNIELNIWIFEKSLI